MRKLFSFMLVSITTMVVMIAGGCGGGGGDSGTANLPVPLTYSVSGNITSGGIGMGGVTVVLSGNSSATTTTDNNGNYSFNSVQNGSYTVTPGKDGYAFTPANRSFTVNGANVTSINFTATVINTYSISGKITINENIASQAKLTIKVMDIGSAVSGQPPLLNLPYNGFTFFLDGVLISVSSAAIDSAVTYSQLRTAIQAAIAAVPSLALLTVTEGQSFTAVDGFTGLQATGQEIVLTNNGSGVLSPGSFLMSGGVIPADGSFLSSMDSTSPVLINRTVGFPGVTVTLSGSGTITTTTDSNGNYTFGSVQNGSYAVTPSRTGFSFTPGTAAVTVNGNHVTNKNFTGL